jgi:predicted secreted hydrolase
MSIIAPPPYPIRPIKMPDDQYLHLGAPAEWWWHTGTLKGKSTSGERTFGFEINAVSWMGGKLFSQVMLTDVTNQMHYMQNAVYPFNAQWAESDPTKPWFVRLPKMGLSPATVTMSGSQTAAQLQMNVQATLVSEAEKTKDKVVTFNLALSQDISKRQPMLIWGTGIMPSAPGSLLTNNFYYSLTQLIASGSISMLSLSNPNQMEEVTVTGITWMDHEYGFFGTAANPVKWVLQDIQIQNGTFQGVTISNYTTLGASQQGLVPNEPSPSQATVQFPDGTTYFVHTFITPRDPWISPVSKKLYYMTLQVDLPSFDTTIIVRSLMNEQEFVTSIPFLGVVSEVYEGVPALPYRLGTNRRRLDLRGTSRPGKWASATAKRNKPRIKAKNVNLFQLSIHSCYSLSSRLALLSSILACWAPIPAQ